MLDARTRGQRLVDAWQAATNRQLAALDELADGALADEKSTSHDIATELCSFWVGCWADTIEVLHEVCGACVDPNAPTKLVDPVVSLAFSIDQDAEAADPIVVPGVTAADAPRLSTTPLKPDVGSALPIPAAHVRVSIYGSGALLSLVALGGLDLDAGVYRGNLDLDGTPLFPVQVTVVATS